MESDDTAQPAGVFELEVLRMPDVAFTEDLTLCAVTFRVRHVGMGDSRAADARLVFACADLPKIARRLQQAYDARLSGPWTPPGQYQH